MLAEGLRERVGTFTEIIQKNSSERYNDLPLQLWNNIVSKAELDSDYGKKLDQWLLGKESKSTVFMRDEICYEFKDFAYESDVPSQRLNHDNAWIPLDSWVSQLRDAEAKNLPNITLGNGTELAFSYFTNFDVPVYESLGERKINLCIVDDEMYSISMSDEPCSPIRDELRPEIFNDYSYNFFEGEFIKKEIDFDMEYSLTL